MCLRSDEGERRGIILTGRQRPVLLLFLSLIFLSSPSSHIKKTDTKGCAKGFWQPPRHHHHRPSQSNRVKGENKWNAAASETAGRTSSPSRTPAGPPPLISQNQLVHLPSPVKLYYRSVTSPHGSPLTTTTPRFRLLLLSLPFCAFFRKGNGFGPASWDVGLREAIHLSERCPVKCSTLLHPCSISLRSWLAPCGRYQRCL